jgi:Glycosyltransferase family 87
MIPAVSATTRLSSRSHAADEIHAPPPRPWKALVLACLGLAALSLFGPSEPTYDPWAWIIWGRQITHLDLSTTSGPSWKPLPILFTTPFALFGDDAAPNLWLLISRAGGLLAIAMAYRLGSRLGGRPAGVIAGGSLLLADEFVRNFSRGNSEGLLVAVCLWAIERHLDGRRTDAFLLGFAAALLRPEVWPFFGLYGLWLAWTEPRRRALVLGVFALNGFLWFAPEYWGSGDWLRAANRAHQPNPDSAAFADHPFLEVFRRSEPILTAPVLLGAVVGIVVAVRERRRELLALAVAAVVLMVTVGLMTEGGFAGNLRYVALPAALVCVLAGVGWVELVRAVRGRFGRGPGIALAAVLVAVAAPFVISDLGSMRDGWRGLRSEANLYGALPAVIAKAGGAESIKRCGPVFTGNFQVQAVAWELKMHSGDVGIEPKPPGIVVAARYHPFSRDERFKLSAENQKWVVRRACAA